MAEKTSRRKASGKSCAAKFANDVKKNKKKYREIVNDMTIDALKGILPSDAVCEWAETVPIEKLKEHIQSVTAEEGASASASANAKADTERIIRDVHRKFKIYVNSIGDVRHPAFKTEKESVYFKAFCYGIRTSCNLSQDEAEIIRALRHT